MKVVSKKGDDFMIQNPILKGFNPDPSICKRGILIILPHRHSSGFPVYRYTSRKI